MAKRNVETMGKSALRAACKAAGISYSKLTVAGMREALLPKQAPAPVATTTPAPEPLVLVGVTTVAREELNGLKRPKDGGVCAAVWGALDQMYAANILPTTAQVRELAIAKNWSVNNAVTELSCWRRWQGLSKSQPGKRGPKRKSSAKAAPPARRIDREVDQYTA